MIKRSIIALLTIITALPFAHAKGDPTFHTRYAEIDTTLQVDALAGPKDLACYVDSSGMFHTSSTSLSELESLIGVTSGVQSQLDGKQNSLGFTPANSSINIGTTSPLTGGGDLTANRTIAIPASTNSVNGYLTSADHTTFAAKESALTFSSPLSRSVNTISIPAATTSVDGYLTSANFNTFNGKESGLTFSTGLTRTTNTITVNSSQNITNLTNLNTAGFVKTTGTGGALSIDATTYTPTTRTISTTAPITGGGDLSANRTLAIAASTNSVDGYLTAADHTIFAAKESALTFSGPLSRSVNTISIPVSTNSIDGYLSAGDHTTFNAKESALTFSTGLTRSTNTITVNTSQNISTLSNLTSNGLIKTSGGTGALSTATSGTDYEVPITAGTGLTRATNTFNVNSSQSIATLSNLTSNGFVKTSGGTGALSIDTSSYLTGNQTVTLSSDVAGSGATAITTTIQPGVVSNSKLANVATATFKGRTTAGTGSPEDLTATQATALLNNFVGDSGSGGTKGLVPAPASGDAAAGKFLKADGTWSVASGGSGITSLNGLTGSTQTFANGTSGTAPAFVSATTTHTLNIPMASASSVTAGLLSKTDYDAFNGKPTGSGSSGRVAYWSGASALTSNSSFLFDGTNFGVGATPDSILTVSKQTTIQAPVSGSTVHYIGLDANPLRVTYDTHNNSSASGTALMFRRSRGTGGTPTAALSGDTLGSLNYRGYGATAYAAASTGLISVMAHQNFTDTAMGTYIAFSTTPDASLTAAEDWRMFAGGKLSNTQADPAAYFDLKAGTATAGTAPIHLTSGTNLTVPVSGTVEYNGTNLEFTDSTPTRHNLAYLDSPAHTFTANNSGSTADRTAVTYNDNPSATYSGTVTWTCGLAPTAPITNRYGWQQIGSHVTGWLMLNYATFGTTCTNIVMDLPAGMPAPLNPGGIGINGDFIWPAFFMQWTNRTTLPTALGRGSLRINAGGTGYEFQETFGSASMRSIHTTIDYWTQ